MKRSSIIEETYLLCRGVAQPGSAPALGAGGRRFKSYRPDQYFQSHKLHFCFSVYSAVGNFVDSHVFHVLQIVFLFDLLSQNPVGRDISISPKIFYYTSSNQSISFRNRGRRFKSSLPDRSFSSTSTMFLAGVEIDSGAATADTGWTLRSTLAGNVAAEKNAATTGSYPTRAEDTMTLSHRN